MSARHLAFALVAAAVMLVVACTGHYTVPIGEPDAAPMIDAANVCTGELYDPCTQSSQCMSGLCKDYNGAGFDVCTEACPTAGCPPDATGSAGRCNMMGLCRPAVANTCTAP